MPLRKIRMRGDTPEERRTLDTLFSATYEELRRLASAVKRSDANATLSPTTLVNEAWLKLASSHRNPVCTSSGSPHGPCARF